MTIREREELALALVVATEARGEPLLGQIAVAWSVRNRAAKPRWWGKDYLSVILKAGQYDGITLALKRGLFDGQSFGVVEDMHLWVARGVLNGWLPDPTGGATHYLNPAAVARMPEWTKTLPKLRTIGHHEFYVEA